jgi:4'-phosphopantetheinyl transferase EntD
MSPALLDRADRVEAGELMASLVPGTVATAETAAECPESGLFPAEQRVIAGAVPKRCREFAAGRACARRALRALGMPAVAVPAGERGEPLWPREVVGSITHCNGLRAAAVARAHDAAALGIDAEPDAPLRAALRRRVAHERELAAAASRGTGNAAGVCVDRLLFSAKEAVYKAWFPLTRRPLGFLDVELAIDFERGTLSARLLVPPAVVDGAELTVLDGRWCAHRGLVCVAVVLPRSGRFAGGLGH